MLMQFGIRLPFCTNLQLQNVAAVAISATYAFARSAKKLISPFLHWEMQPVYVVAN